MNVKKFYADTARDALRLVREELGPDAVILSNHRVGDKIEIMAAPAADVAAIATVGGGSAPHSRRQPAPSAPVFTPPPSVEPRPYFFPGQTPPKAAAQPKGAGLKFQVEEVNEPVADSDNLRDLEQEIKFLRNMLEGQLASFAWGEIGRRQPAKLELMRRLLAAGFSPALARQLLEKMPVGFDAGKGLPWLKSTLINNLRVVAKGHDIVDAGGVYALVGPTGVGKTTTVAKLAARCTLKFGANQVALITTDSFRIGAHEQLRIYGKILGIPVYAVKEENDLQFTLADVRDKHLVLVDTVGMSQRDQRVAEQVAFLCGNSREVKRLLLLSGNAQGSTLDDVVAAYRGAGLDGCILTKIDEGVNVGTALDVIIRHRLLLHYVTNGQRVPEDLHLANPIYLVDRVFKQAGEASPFTPQEEEFSLVVAASAAGDGALLNTLKSEEFRG
ncbi:MAG: flagellar biosynthesis protein FlhF [Sulfuricella sp.]|nr:flagellar biosynthesis protein FlhF [Sulfuricella sp.]